jgi:hypothetical protein
MSLEERVTVIEQKLGIPSPNSASMDMDTASMDIAPMDSAPMDSAPMDSTPMDSTPMNMGPTPMNTPPSILTMTISLNGYNGTVGDVFSKIRSKISDLDRPTNKGRYSSRVNELRTLLGNLMRATTVQEIQSKIGSSLSFKNNNLMGGKSKRRGRKSNKSRRR